MGDFYILSLIYIYLGGNVMNINKNSIKKDIAKGVSKVSNKIAEESSLGCFWVCFYEPKNFNNKKLVRK